MVDQPRKINEIEPGTYQMRLVKGGPYIPALLEVVSGNALAITMNGIRQDETYPIDGVEDRIAATMLTGTAHRDPLVRFHYAEKISREEYDLLLRVLAFAKREAPDHPMLNPMKPVDLSAIKSLW